MKKNCVYCNKNINEEGNRYILKVKNESLSEIRMCSKDCYVNMQRFIEKRDKYQPFMYISLAILLILNLVALGFMPDTNYNYLALSLMGVVIIIAPYMHIRYRSYVAKGVLKTLFTLRLLGGAIAIMSLVFFFFA